MDPTVNKRCKRCGEVKPLDDDFHRDAVTKDGRRGKCKECAKAVTRKWVTENRERARSYGREYQRENYAKHRTRTAVGKAVLRGKLTKPDRCSRCHTVGPVEGHHESYEAGRELDVVWVCKTCHWKEHA